MGFFQLSNLIFFLTELSFGDKKEEFLRKFIAGLR